MENKSFKKESFQRVENSSDKKSQLIVNNCICKTQNLERQKKNFNWNYTPILLGKKSLKINSSFEESSLEE